MNIKTQSTIVNKSNEVSGDAFLLLVDGSVIVDYTLLE